MYWHLEQTLLNDVKADVLACSSRAKRNSHQFKFYVSYFHACHNSWFVTHRLRKIWRNIFLFELSLWIISWPVFMEMFKRLEYLFFSPNPLLRLYKDLLPYSLNCNFWRRIFSFCPRSLSLLILIHSSIGLIIKLLFGLLIMYSS